MKVERIIADLVKLLDEGIKILDETILKSPEERKRLYLDYRESLRDAMIAIYQMIGKMRADKLVDPEFAEKLLVMPKLSKSKE